MFTCTDCIKEWEGPTIDRALKGLVMRSYGRCEFCGKTDSCYDLWSGDPGWYRIAPHGMV